MKLLFGGHRHTPEVDTKILIRHRIAHLAHQQARDRLDLFRW
jgi:hypothetical protein